MRSTRFMAVALFVAACGGKGSTNDEPDIDAADGGPVCGDNIVEAPEECDDGNTAPLCQRA
jgi:hypothetical protein